jgi:hypothetical protein
MWPDLAERHRLIPGERLQRHLTQPGPHHGARGPGRQIVAMAAPRVVGMGMCNDRAVHRTPGVDVEVTRLAIEALGAQHHEIAPPHADPLGDGPASALRADNRARINTAIRGRIVQPLPAA